MRDLDWYVTYCAGVIAWPAMLISLSSVMADSFTAGNETQAVVLMVAFIIFSYLAERARYQSVFFYGFTYASAFRFFWPRSWIEEEEERYARHLRDQMERQHDERD